MRPNPDQSVGRLPKLIRGYQMSKILVKNEFILARMLWYSLIRAKLEASHILQRYQRELLEDMRLEVLSRKDDERWGKRED